MSIVALFAEFSLILRYSFLEHFHVQYPAWQDSNNEAICPSSRELHCLSTRWSLTSATSLVGLLGLFGVYHLLNPY